MKIGMSNWARPFASAWRVLAFTLVVCATGGAWARTTLLNYMNFDATGDNGVVFQKDGGTIDPAKIDGGYQNYSSGKFGAHSYQANNGVVGLQENTSGLVSVADGFTISFWFNPNNQGNWNSFFGFGLLNGDNYYFVKRGDNTFNVYKDTTSTDDSSVGTPVIDGVSYTGGAWNHVAIVCQPGGTSASLYVNGTAYTLSLGDISSTSLREVLLCRGRWHAGADSAFYRNKQTTLFDDFALFSGALNWPAISMISAGASTISDLVARGLDVSLEEFGGFVTTEPQLAFKSATLSEITADSLKGRFGGGSIGNKGTAATFFNFVNPDSATLTCEAQLDGELDGSTEILKSVFLTFTRSGDDVYVSANSVTKYMSKEENPLGTSLANQGTGNSLATSISASGYGIYNLRLPRTYESDATVVWNAGELLMPKIGTDGNKYVISLPASGISVDGSGNLKVASSGATTGATIDTPNTHIASVLIKYSSLSACANSKVSLATAKATYNANGSLVVVGARTTANNALTMTGYWDNSSENTYGFNTVPSLTAGAGYFMYSYHNDTCGNGGTYAYAGTSLSNLSGGGNTTLRWTNDGYWIKQLSVGGPITTNSGVKAWPNVAIEKVALFIGSESYYKGSDVSGFLFSTEATITAAGTYTLAGNNPLFASVNSDESYLINVLESATLSIPAATSVNKITFNVAEGKTLTVTGKTLIANNVVALGEGTLAFDVSDYNCKALARNAVAGAPYRVWPGRFSAASGNMTIDTSSVEVPAGYFCNVISTSKGPALEFTTEKQFGSLNINFPGGRNSTVNNTDARVSDNATYSGLMHGAAPVVGTSWNDVPAQNASDVAIAKYIRQDGSVANDGTATITLSNVNNPYTTGSNDGDRILFGYCDDGGSPVVTINNIPFAKYRVIAYAATDTGNTTFCPKTINGVSYSTAAAGSSATPTVSGGTGAWGDSNSRSTLAEGVNYLVSDVIESTSTVTINNIKTAALGRAAIPAVQIVEVGVNNTYDIDADDTYTFAAMFGSMSAGCVYEVNVNESATLNIADNATAGKVIFNVADGEVLTITGSSTLTATTIEIKGDGSVETSNGSVFAGTVKGDGRIVFAGVLPASSLQASFQDGNSWTGTVEIKDYEQKEETDSHQIINFNKYGNINSTVALNGVTSTMFASTARGGSSYPDITLKEIEIGEGGWTDARTSTYGVDMYYTAKLTGHGPITVKTGGTNTIKFIGEHTFDGSITMDSSTGKRVAFMRTSSDALPSTFVQKAIVVASGLEMSIASGKTWTAPGGVDVRGALKVNGTGSISGNVALSASATLDISGFTGATPAIPGALTLADGATLKLPAGTTLPYQIASSGTACIITGNYTIGEDAGAESGLALTEDGCLDAANVATITTDTVLSDLEAGGKYLYKVAANATVDVSGVAADVGIVQFIVNTGVRLKLSGEPACPYSISGDAFAIAENENRHFTATAVAEVYPSIGSLSSSGTTVTIDNAASLSAGSYPLARWVTPQKLISGYGYVASLDVTDLPEGLSAELVYGVKTIYLRVWSPAAQAAKGTIKLWPYGDSITEGFNMGGTKANYRVLLAQKLSLLGYNVEMVGTTDKIQTVNNDVNAFAPSIDPSGQNATGAWQWHSAKHGGTAGPTSATGRSNEMENVDTLCVQVGNPDAVLLLIGVNDLAASGQTPASTFGSWTNVINRLVANLPNSKIIASTHLYGNVADPTRANQAPSITAFNALVRPYMANMPAAWQNHVIFLDLNELVGSYADKAADDGVIYNANGDWLHPDWWGHDQMAEGWLSVITNKFTSTQTFPSATVPAAPSTDDLGAAAKSELAAYRKGFKLCRRIDVASNIDTSDPYAASGEGATANIEKVGYFVEYVRADNHAHKWVWVDMDAFGTTLDAVGLPNANHQQVVTSLHVKSNHAGIEDVAADDDSVSGFVEFSPYDYTGGASGVTGAPTGNASCYDWNDTLSNTGSYGSMQVHRISPSSGRGGQVLFAYNNWQSSTSTAEFGIGNFSQHFFGGGEQTFDYTKTSGLVKMNADAYSVKRIEIWTKSKHTATMSADSNFGELMFAPTLPDDLSASDFVINVTDNATLTFNSAKSVRSITFNIAENKTLTLDGVSNLTVGEVIVAGPGKLAFAASPAFGALRVASNVTIALASGQSIALTGALTVDSGVTLTMEPASLEALTGTMISAGSVVNNGTVALTAPDSGSDYSVSITGTAVTLRRVTKNAFAYNPVPGDNTPTGWITGWGGESFATTSLRVGPSSDTPYVYHVTSGNHPWSSLGAKTAPFSIAFYADLSKLESGNRVLVAFGTSSNGLIIYKNDDAPGTVRVGRASGGAIGNGYISVEYPKTGYHLYTVTCAADGTLCAYVDDGSVYKATNAEGTKIATGTFGAGFQIGSTYQGNIDWMSPGVGMAVGAIRGYDVVLQPEEVETLSESFPATDGNVTWNVAPDNADNTVIVTSATFGDSNYIAQSKGTLTIPEGSEVNVKHIRVLNNNNTGDRATVNIAGTLNITSTSTNPNTWADRESNKGVLFGHYHGQGTYNITGSLLAEDTYIETVYTAEAQLLDISGGTVKTKALYAKDGNSNSTVKLRDGGTLEVAEILSSGSAITKEFKYGTFRVMADATETRAINFSAAGGYATTLDPHGNTLTLQSAALTGSGDITVADSSNGGNGTVVFVGGTGYTGRLIMTDANAANIDISGYAGTVLCQGTAAETIAMFDGFAGTVYFTGNVDATALDLSGATVHIADNCTFTAVAGKEGSLVLGSGAVATLNVDDNTVKYEGYVPVVSGSGTVGYYNTGTSEAVSGADHVNGNNLLPYYNVWSASATASENTLSANAAARWKSDDGVSGVLPADNKNVAFKLENGDTVTLLVDATKTFNDIQVFGNGTLIIQKSDENVMTVRKGLYTTANVSVQIDSGLAFANYTKLEVESALPKKVAVNCGTAESPYGIPTVTGSGALQVTAGHALAALSLTVGNLDVDGALTLYGPSSATAITVGSAGVVNANAATTATTLTVNAGGVVNVAAGVTLTAPTLAVNGMVNMTSTSSFSGLTTLSGAGSVTWTGKQPDGTIWKDAAAWTGTNIVMSTGTTDITNLTPENWGRNGSYIVMKNLKGYIDTNNATVQAKVVFENGDNGYALAISNGYGGRRSYFREIAGNGTIKDVGEKTDGGGAQLFVFKTASEFTGSIINLGTEGKNFTKIFVFSSNKTDSSGNIYGRIIVEADGSAVIGDGEQWNTQYGAIVGGNVTLQGAATMATVTFSNDATIKLSGDTAKYLTTTGTLTWPLSGTVTIDASACASSTVKIPVFAADAANANFSMSTVTFNPPTGSTVVRWTTYVEQVGGKYVHGISKLGTIFSVW